MFQDGCIDTEPSRKQTKYTPKQNTSTKYTPMDVNYLFLSLGAYVWPRGFSVLEMMRMCSHQYRHSRSDFTVRVWTFWALVV